jgi:hypothetical protein
VPIWCLIGSAAKLPAQAPSCGGNKPPRLVHLGYSAGTSLTSTRSTWSRRRRRFSASTSSFNSGALREGSR